jgi:hypothetical protein
VVLVDAFLKAEPSERATTVAQLASKVIDKCEPLKKEFGAVGADEGADKGMILSMAVKPALIACNCEANIPDLRSIMFRILYVPRPMRVVSFDAKANKERIKFPKTTTWAESSQRFTPTLRNAELIAD